MGSETMLKLGAHLLQLQVAPAVDFVRLQVLPKFTNFHENFGRKNLGCEPASLAPGGRLGGSIFDPNSSL